MTRLRRVSRVFRPLAFLLAAALVPALPPPGALAASAYETSFARFAAMAPDPARVGSLSGLKLRRDVGRFQFTQGQMALLTPVEGRVWGAVFTGQGSFGFRPSTSIERDQLRRFYKTDSLVVVFDDVVLLFADSTLVELAAKARFTSGIVAKEAMPALQRTLDLLLDKKTREMSYAIGKTWLEGSANELFFAYIHPIAGSPGPVILQIDPGATEPVQLSRPLKAHVFQGRIRETEVISKFPLGTTDEPTDSLRFDRYGEADSVHYRVHTRFGSGLKLTGETEVRFRPIPDGQNWVTLELHPDLEVDSVLWEDAGRADFFKGRRAQLLWVRSDRPLRSGETRRLRIRYHGQVVQREDDWVHYDPTSSWHPELLASDRATYDLTYEVSDTYTLVSVGEPVATPAKRGWVVSTWHVASPIRRASFMLGVYKQHRIQSEKAPPVTILMAESAHRRLRGEAGEDLVEQGLAPGKGMEKQVGADVANSLAFFQNLYGPTTLKHFYVVENPLGASLGGLAYPGLIHLSWQTFYNTQSEGIDEVLRAHEVAHQWWGALGVAPATYHDRWLSEAFAEFSALCYLQAIAKDNKIYLDALRRSRDRMLGNRKYLFSTGQETGPIWLGPRTRTSTTREDYELVIYEKGAWILHMLRNLFLDLDTMKDGGFGDMMREFYATYAGRDATTADFRRMVEKYAGRDMGWFFREWVYGTEIPRYRFAWRAAPAGSDSFRVRCRVEQQNVSEDFQMIVPLLLDLGGERYAKVRVLVKGRRSEFELPLLPAKPERIVFNDLESALCEVESVSW